MRMSVPFPMVCEQDQGWLTRIVTILSVACIKDVSGDISVTKLLASAQDDGSYDAWPWVGWMCCDVPKTPFHFQWEFQKFPKPTLTLVEVHVEGLSNEYTKDYNGCGIIILCDMLLCHIFWHPAWGYATIQYTVYYNNRYWYYILWYDIVWFI